MALVVTCCVRWDAWQSMTLDGHGHSTACPPWSVLPCNQESLREPPGLLSVCTLSLRVMTCNPGSFGNSLYS